MLLRVNLARLMRNQPKMNELDIDFIRVISGLPPIRWGDLSWSDGIHDAVAEEIDECI